ncbi:hypothetical protein H0E87_014612 [Populus deltoides]|uniref:Uncharacterized protein n=1 Tax=Populus deltoides TaxID=3696 RepID=A0A8T2YEA4_POPDE|nr:hypothetical protein H0E87_014612 [Populus deltoides]
MHSNRGELHLCMNGDEESLPGAGTKLVLGDLFPSSTRLLAQLVTGSGAGMKLVLGDEAEEIVAAVVGLGGGWSGAMLTERVASGAGEEMAGGAVVGQEREDEREDGNS